MSAPTVCPVDGCDWSLPPLGDPIPGNALAGVFGPGVMAAVARNQDLQRIEDQLAAHYREHAPQEFLRTITRLQAELDGAGVAR